MIKLSHVSKSFDDQKSFVVDDISFEIEDGETLVLLGSSGCGKTTLLKMINRLVEPSAGHIAIDGTDIHTLNPVQLRRQIGYVFQGIGLFPHLTVEENIAIVLRLNKQSPQQRRQRAHELMEIINLNPNVYAHRYPDELSGGQCQRVGVARALASQPKYLLMDEPFGALDAINRATLQQELLEIKQHLNVTLIFVTHDIFEALRIGDRIAVMNRGRIEQIGSKAAILNQPATDFVKKLFQHSKDQLANMSEHIK